MLFSVTLSSMKHTTMRLWNISLVHSRMNWCGFGSFRIRPRPAMPLPSISSAYNRQRLHQTLSYQSPEEFEQQVGES